MKIQISTFIAILGIATIHAQQSVNTAGGGASSSMGSLEYSVGQVVYTTHGNSAAGTISGGVQHAYEIFTTAADDATNDILLSTFPNPATDRLVLQVEGHYGHGLYYLLCDGGGRLLKEANIGVNQTEINMAGLPGGVYYLHVQVPLNQALKTFTIIKTE